MKDKKNIRVTVAGIVLGIANMCVAQEWSFEIVKSNLTNFAVDVGDFNSDGAPDLLLHDTPNVLVWYENLQPGWQTHTIDTNTILNVEFGGIDLFDVDDDGALDILAYATTDPGKIVWYKNMMDGTEWPKRTISDAVNEPGNMVAAVSDFDEDDDFDVAVPGVGDGNVLWFENMQGDTSWMQHQVQGLGGLVWLTVANMDQDNDPDIVAGSFSSGEINWYENQLPNPGWPVHPIATIPGTALGRSVDIDGDGDQDLVSHSLQSGVLVLFENPSWQPDTLTAGIPGIWIGDIADIDGDLDFDVTFGGNNHLGWCENLGDNAGWQRHVIDQLNGAFPSAEGLADIDGDGDADIVATLGNGELRWYVNPTTTAVDDANRNHFPAEFTLFQNHPNPFNPLTTIRYGLEQDTWVNLAVYNTLGQVLVVLVDEFQQAGFKSVQWDGRTDNGDVVSSGVYFYKLQANGQSKSLTMVFSK